MTQISRPFQIALGAVVLLAAVWFIALRGHSSGGESTNSTPAASAPALSASAPSKSSSAGQGSPGGGSSATQAHTYTGSAPGVAGLTRAIAKAQGAVKESEQNAKQLQQKAAQAESPTQSGGSAPSSATQQGAAAQGAATQSASASSSTSASSSAPDATQAAKHATPAAKPRATAHPAHPKTAASATSKQTLVEGELEHGQTVIVLFWSARGTVDVAVHRQLELLQGLHAKHGLAQNKDIAVHFSSAGEVGQYGTITGSLQVLQTPTMLVISPSGRTKTLTGLVDAYAIQQAIKEARAS